MGSKVVGWITLALAILAFSACSSTSSATTNENNVEVADSDLNVSILVPSTWKQAPNPDGSRMYFPSSEDWQDIAVVLGAYKPTTGSGCTADVDPKTAADCELQYLKSLESSKSKNKFSRREIHGGSVQVLVIDNPAVHAEYAYLMTTDAGGNQRLAEVSYSVFSSLSKKYRSTLDTILGSVAVN